jgi:hypothetical protein
MLRTMKPVTEYFILKATNTEHLVQLVNAAIKEDNKQPFGFPFAISGTAGGITICQAMAFYRMESEDF